MKFLLLIFAFLLSHDPMTWTTDMDTAKAMAAAEDKTIMMVFSGSDWCAPCKKLKKSILTSQEFSDFENENLVILYLDFPARKKNKLSKEQTKKNEDLAEKYNQSGAFPKVLLLNSEEKVLGEVKYEGQNPSDFIKEVESKI